MRYGFFSLLIAAASAAPNPSKSPLEGLFDRLSLPIPTEARDGNGFKAFADLFHTTAPGLQVFDRHLASAHLKVTGDAKVNKDLSAEIARGLFGVTEQLWQKAAESERIICIIASSINKQNWDGQKSYLLAGIDAEAKAIFNLKITLEQLIAKILKNVNGFTDQEKRVFDALVKAIARAAPAALSPVKNLEEGLLKSGREGFGAVFDDLKVSVAALVSLTSGAKLGVS